MAIRARRNLREADPPHVGRGGEPGQVADDATPEGDDPAVALEAGREERLVEERQPGRGPSTPPPRGAQTSWISRPQRLQGLAHRAGPQRPDPLLGHQDGRPAPLGELGERRPPAKPRAERPGRGSFFSKAHGDFAGHRVAEATIGPSRRRGGGEGRPVRLRRRRFLRAGRSGAPGTIAGPSGCAERVPGVLESV